MIQTWTPEIDKPETPDYRTVKAWFQQCRDLAAQIETQKQKISRIRDTAEKCTQTMNGMPMEGGVGDKVGFAVERMDTERRTLQRMETDLCNLRIEATRRAYCLSGSARSEKQAKCICGWYVDLKPQKEIADDAGLSRSNSVSVYIHDGFEALAEIWEDVQNIH